MIWSWRWRGFGRAIFLCRHRGPRRSRDKILVSLVVSRAVTAPLMAMTFHLEQMVQGGGDLTRRIPVASRDEIGHMALLFNKFVERLAEIIGDVRGRASAVTGSSSHVVAVSGGFGKLI